MKIFNDRIFTNEFQEEAAKSFQGAEPFPNMYIDDLLDEEFCKTLYDNFPTAEQMRRHYEGLNEKKSEGSNFDQYHESFTQLREALAQKEFVEVLEKITGIDGLILPDDHRGTGVHQGTDGSFLDIHVDFSVHPVLNLHRRLNLLIFFNKEWKDEYGGALELWDEKVKNLGAEIFPHYNRGAMFATSEISWHGYDQINLPEGMKRNSFFTYYYTPISEENPVKYHDTIFKTRPNESKAKAVKTAAKESTKNFIKGAMRKLGMNKIFDKIE